MPPYAWAALGIFVAALAAGLTSAALNGFRAWRAFRHARRALGRGVDGLMHGIAAAESRLGRAEDAAARLERARRQLQKSLAAGAVIAAAAGDARAALRVLGFLRR